MQQRLLAPEPVNARAHRAKRVSFGFGRRFFFITLLGLLWSIPAFWDVRFLLVMAAWDACAVIAWAVDLARLPRADRLVVERSWTHPPSLSNATEVTIELRNESGVPIECSVLDDLPRALIPEPPEVVIKVPARDSASVRYIVRPLERGDIKLGAAY